MNEIVERVARAICISHGLHADADAFKHGALRHYPIWQTYEEDARAAIEAMREPTQTMKDADTRWMLDEDDTFPTHNRLVWQKMIDEALK